MAADGMVLIGAKPLTAANISRPHIWGLHQSVATVIFIQLKERVITNEASLTLKQSDISPPSLTHLPLDIMATISQTIC